MRYVPDFKSLKNLILTSRSFHETFVEHESAVAKQIMTNLIGKTPHKLVVMTEVSDYINVTDWGAVKQFIDTYSSHTEWPLHLYNIRLAASVQHIHIAMNRCTNDKFSDKGFDRWNMGGSFLTPRERGRLRRILYICEIAGNLFHWNHGVLGNTFYMQPPFPELSRAFWKKVPAWDAARLEILVSSDRFWDYVGIWTKLNNDVDIP
ncbi:hypothetical protein F5X98DRAFT_391780 [Xylaria grammica]|nr:hypothetical protein F5X98DRAFT_391780 [Xylaria grammica]